jgi:hypothetical protein
MIWFATVVMTNTLSGFALDPASGSASVPTTVRPASAAALMAAESRRVRSNNQRVVKLLNEGVRRSPTFADLITKIHTTNVIVYVEPSYALAPDLQGRILLQAVAGDQRYLRVQVRATLQGDLMIAVIAHELRHALEVADDQSVVDDAGLTALYRRIGHISSGSHSFDTDAAQATGRRVRDELAS